MTWIVEVRALKPGPAQVLHCYDSEGHQTETLEEPSATPWFRLAAPGGQLIACGTQEEAEGMAREWQAAARQVRALLGEHLWLWDARAVEEGTP